MGTGRYLIPRHEISLFLQRRDIRLHSIPAAEISKSNIPLQRHCLSLFPVADEHKEGSSSTGTIPLSNARKGAYLELSGTVRLEYQCTRDGWSYLSSDATTEPWPIPNVGPTHRRPLPGVVTFHLMHVCCGGLTL